jgi:hypothetical protein
MNILSNPAVVAALASATTPEEMARKFKRAVSLIVADAMATGIDEALSSAATAFSGNPKVAGWEAQIGGLIGNLTWDRVGDTDILPVTPIAVYAARDTSKLVSLGVNATIGVSIGISF